MLQQRFKNSQRQLTRQKNQIQITKLSPKSNSSYSFNYTQGSNLSEKIFSTNKYQQQYLKSNILSTMKYSSTQMKEVTYFQKEVDEVKVTPFDFSNKMSKKRSKSEVPTFLSVFNYIPNMDEDITESMENTLQQENQRYQQQFVRKNRKYSKPKSLDFKNEQIKKEQLSYKQRFQEMLLQNKYYLNKNKHNVSQEDEFFTNTTFCRNNLDNSQKIESISPRLDSSKNDTLKNESTRNSFLKLSDSSFNNNQYKLSEIINNHNQSRFYDNKQQNQNNEKTFKFQDTFQMKKFKIKFKKNVKDNKENEQNQMQKVGQIKCDKNYTKQIYMKVKKIDNEKLDCYQVRKFLQ